MFNESQTIARWEVPGGYSLIQVEKFPDEIYLKLFNEHMLRGHPILPWGPTRSPEEKERAEQLAKRLTDKFQIRLALVHSGEFVGWSYGWQDSVHAGDFYMASSLVIPAHRKKGLYSSMVQKILELPNTAGFSAVRSRHVCTNNAVLIAKMKLGFTINGFEQDETMGTLVRMIYHHNELRRKAARFRAGQMDESEVLAQLNKGF